MSYGKRINAHDMRLHLIQQALYWRRERRACCEAMKDWMDGRYAEAIENLWWLKGRVG